MRTTFAVLALAALSVAQPQHHRKRGQACPAKSSYNKGSDGGDESYSGHYKADYNSKPAEPAQPAQPAKAAQPATGATCPNDAGKTLAGTGSCKCDFAINCNAKADHSASAKFWERKKDEKIGSLAECVKICDDNALCTATIWVGDSSSGDYLHCWQTSGLGGVTGTGQGQISYKGSCSGSCSESYLNA